MKKRILTLILGLTACMALTCGLAMTGCGDAPHEHVFGDVSYVWIENDTVCVATRTCTLDSTHVEEERATATLTTTTESTYLNEGAGTMTATFTNPAFEEQDKNVVIPKKDAITSFEGAQVNGNDIFYVVPAETTSLQFNDVIQVPNDCTLIVLDTYGDPIENNDTSSLWELYEGSSNEFTVKIVSDQSEEVYYDLIVHRVYQLSVYYKYYDNDYYHTLYTDTITSAQFYTPNPEFVNNVEGYTFNGFKDYYWNEYQPKVLYADEEVFIDRTANKYTVTFDKDAGDMAGTTTLVEYGSIPNFERPSRPGCQFLGWSLDGVQITNEYGYGYYDAKWHDACDKEVVALWYYNTYYINYFLDGGKNNEGNPQEYTAYGETITLLDPTKDSAFTVNSYKTAVFEAEEGSDIKLGGIDYYTNSKIRVDKTVTDYQFDGWYREETFETPVTELELTYETIYLYAKWTAKDPENKVEDVDFLVVDEDGNYDARGNYVLMGTYPQTIKSASVTVDETLNGSNGWNVGSDGCLYKKISAMPYWSDYSKPTYYFSDNEEIVRGTEYFFKLEPMKWRLLNGHPNPTGTGWTALMSDKAIDANVFDAQCEAVYETSFLREFFLTNFLGLHFPQSVKDVMVDKTVKNDLSSTKEYGLYIPDGFEEIWDSNPHVGPATVDKIYALSAEELTSGNFSMKFTTADERRRVTPTDYALARGAAARTEGEYKGNVSWWTRSPYPRSDGTIHNAMTVSADGSLATQGRYSYEFGLTRTDSSGYGIVPATTLNIRSWNS
ncbi:MAG: InlB B-repeat-containing protein [Clostridia bacterium]|nr:InlB B-repeat-containing protein [Clostridia bacterium]